MKNSNQLLVYVGTFYDCKNLINVPEIPSTITNMGHAFRECTSLSEVPEIPDSVTNMEATFYGCTSLMGSVKINAKNCAYMTYNSFGTVFGGITNQLTVQVPANSVTYDTIYALYKDSSNITIETF